VSDFHSSEKRRAAKTHACAHCHKAIEPGTLHWASAQVHEGEFDAYREHFECKAAWETLNFDNRGIDRSEGAPFLFDDDHEEDDRLWMAEEFPIVAGRLGWRALA